ncbi:uncharacterized protein BKA55DRAFT_696815 [Fusarium redolens]|uniref:Uncharacterized protein n=1 Tax=Fusarium redolens TaxID=48865 RepID=A0A9P9G1L2_FUSRE|nr:uncharacterized protein BKA55DRAFT_696815 [Fusarium redolens]KAH7228486.1 hypothetical protein BKA55DRAFT_696815 [Fusarium redolens]
MSQVRYNSLVETIFKSPNLDRRIQRKIIRDLSDNNNPRLQSTIELNARHIICQARAQGYNVITRFVPPYCSTVTFYTTRIGFVTVSQLSPTFDSNLERVADNFDVTRGAINTLEAAYRDTLLLNGARHGASACGSISHLRDKTAHQKALNGSTLEYNQVYIRLECPPSTNPGPILTFNPPQQDGGVHIVQHKLRIIFHCLFGDSKVNFRKGPAAVINDFLYKTHEGKYAKNVHLIGGELSAHLTFLGRIFACLNLNATNAGIAVIIGLFTSAKIGNENIALTLAASILLGLRIWQWLWTLLMTTTTYENIASNDLRLRTEEAAASLYALDYWYLALLLAMISPQENIYGRGTYRSWLDVAGSGILEMTGPAPPELLYFAGYITTSLDPSELDNRWDSCAPLAAWVPYDTHRITYASNDKVRKISLIDNFLHLSSSSRASLREHAGSLVFKHDGDEFSLPRTLRIYSKEIG